MKKVLLLVCSLFLASCAHHRDVRPGADGVHRVVVATEDTDQGSRNAIDQANHYCKQSKRQAAFLEEESKYKGDLDEKTYKNAKRVTKVAQVLGGGVWAMGGKRESDAGGIVGLGGTAGDAALGKGYQVSMKFKCQ